MPHYDRPLQYYSQACPAKILNALYNAVNGRNVVFVGADLTNKSGGAAEVGLAFTLGNSLWKAGSITAASTPDYLDDTTDAQSVASGDFPLFTLTNNDGFLVQANYKFGAIYVNVSTAASGGAPVYAYQYYNGSAMTTLTTIEVPSWASTGEKVIVFIPPSDWALGSTAAVGADSDKYCIQVIATTASITTGGTASLLALAELYAQKSIANGATLNIIPEDSRGIVLKGDCTVLAYFGATNAANVGAIRYRERG